MTKNVTLIVKTESLQLTHDQTGFWLYDYTRGMNLAMRAESEQYAFIEALEYYQQRLYDVERQYKLLESKVNAFVSQFIDDYRDE